jgi:CP family cyanate transporter-like MFS transporter
MSAERGGFLLSVAGLSSLLTTFTVPVLAARARDQRALVSGCVLACLAAFVLLLIAPVGAAYPAVILLGLGQGAAIGLSLTLMVLRAPDAHLASELSGMAQSVGYLVAALGPLVVGALAGATGGWTWPVVLLAVLLVPEWLVGLGAARNIQVHPGVSGPRSSVVAG